MVTTKRYIACQDDMRACIYPLMLMFLANCIIGSGINPLGAQAPQLRYPMQSCSLNSSVMRPCQYQLQHISRTRLPRSYDRFLWQAKRAIVALFVASFRKTRSIHAYENTCCFTCLDQLSKGLNVPELFVGMPACTELVGTGVGAVGVECG